MNILQFIWHDLGDYLGCCRRPEVPSPNLDAFSREGVVFDNNFCTAPQCSPSRAAIMTGRYPHANGMMGLAHRGWRYNAGERDLPRILNDAGYSTWLFGHQHEWQALEDVGYRHHDVSSRRAPAVAGKAAAFFRNEARGRQPFYVNVGFHEVHRVYGQAYDPEVLKRVRVPGFLPDVDVVRKDLAAFYENIRLADEAVGSVLGAVREAGLDEDTLVLFTTDHGPEFPRAKMTLYDPGIRTALVMRLGGVIEAGTRAAPLISNVDVLPTLLEAAGVDVPANVQGRSFWPLLTGGACRPRQEVFVELTWHGGQYDPMRGIRTEQWKYIRNFIPGRPILIGGPPAQRYGVDFIEKHYSAWRPEDELYDLARDPDEKNNLARSPEASKTLADLRARLMQFLDDTADPLLRGDVPQPVYSDYECYWTMKQGAKYRLVIGEDFREYPFPA